MSRDSLKDIPTEIPTDNPLCSHPVRYINTRSYLHMQPITRCTTAYTIAHTGMNVTSIYVGFVIIPLEWSHCSFPTRNVLVHSSFHSRRNDWPVAYYPIRSSSSIRPTSDPLHPDAQA